MAINSDLVDFSPLLESGSLELIPQNLSEEAFFEFALQHPHLRIEQEINGNIYIMSPVGFDSGFREGHPYGILYAWWLGYRKGRVFSPSTMFKLHDGSKKMADAAWASEENVQSIPMWQRKRIATVVPEFIIEVCSENDNLEKLKRKMTDDWMKNGVQLAWLIDPLEREVWIYRKGQMPEKITDFTTQLSGEGVCPGLLFDLSLMDLN